MILGQLAGSSSARRQKKKRPPKDKKKKPVGPRVGRPSAGSDAPQAVVTEEVDAGGVHSNQAIRSINAKVKVSAVDASVEAAGKNAVVL